MIDKLREMVEDGEFTPWPLTNAKGWPRIPEPIADPEDEGDPYLEMLDLENWKITHIGERCLTIKGGGDWQDAYEVNVIMNDNDELEVEHFYKTDYHDGQQINMNLLLDLDIDD